jgi:hypothetical protein
MPLPSRPQTFYESSRDLLEKLRREIERYRSMASDDDVEQLKDIAFNASVTAWQLADWVFNDMTPAQRKRLAIKDDRALQEHARTKCRALYLCRHAATASKHWEITRHPDPNIQTVVKNESGWKIFFVDNNKSTAADEVFELALHFWTTFIQDNDIAKRQCSRCFDTGLVCKAHDNHPGEGEHACRCGAPSMPCPVCNSSAPFRL